MIYLITGTPGTGKTSMVVDMILNNYEGLFKTEAEDGTIIDRPLYFCHIDGLDAQKFKAHRLTEEQLQEKPLNEIVPTGSVIIVDECDYTYPVRSASRSVPPYIQTLKELRHEGFTLILMTQHPSMIDKYIRNLVGKHIHLERKHVGTKRYEFFRCEENLNESAFSGATVNYYKPPKEAFKYYKSASKHIKFTKKSPTIFYIAPIIFLTFLWLGYRFIAKYSGTDEVQQVSDNTATIASMPYSASSPTIADEQESASMPIGAKVSDYIPRIDSLPETKPLYDSLRQPKNMEVVAGCVQTSNSCNCYTDQATKVYVNAELCQSYVKNGIFNIYRNEEQPRIAAVQ
ncbi:Zonula occludens toxin [Kingella kingae]|uniref:zonular occludens toxin domain-containing protein n=1 Tax=Kingella kingae TaxID=504 RepID=UPI000E02F494|nr:zonular occludens toxin domain-containing protein [Kingella kingae]MDK4535171.1 zonular occludens toxin domain-containing protein [Kingella kingae]MDK4545545.1 zonular occludens toxin domain-containing protein [Kingella kingae]MDK4554215.1 zonular occludens toxin domain-containing protein [Kingella kingae]MDK4581285.1 zonular occludens toxin domain-containing protein [Kingella kingae]QIP47324.1 AAA family ATPase [Kingella kingae]